MEINSKRALVLNYAAISHINAELPLCALLKKNGYNIHICSYHPAKDYVQQQGFQFYQLNTYPFGMGYENSINSQSENKYLDELIDRFTNRMYVQRSREIHRMVKELRPSIILIDVFLSTDFIILYKIAKENKIKICFIQTALSSYYGEGSALSTPLFSPSSNSDLKQTSKEWKSFFISRAIVHIKEKIKYIGRNDLSLIKKKLIENRIPDIYSIDMKKAFHISFDGIPEIVLNPFCIEHTKQKHRDRQFYSNIGILINRREIFDKKFSTSKRFFLEEKKLKKKIVYCSFGTIHTNTNLLNKLTILINKVAEDHKNIIFIVSLDKNATISSDNVYTFDRLPQLDVLRMSDLFITHGGINSIKESIHFRVPMIVCPTEFSWDQHGTARLVERLGIGVKVDIATVEDIQLGNYINDVLNSESYSKNLEYISTQIDMSVNEQETLQYIENIPNLL